MIALMIALAALVAADPPAPADPTPWSPAQLREEPRLWNVHQAYLTYLSAHDDLAQLEAEWLDFALDPQNRPSVAALEETLQTNEALRDAYTRHFRHLAAHPDSQVQVVELADIERELPQAAAEGIAYLREHPQWATAFLKNPNALTMAPSPVSQLAGLLKDNPELRQRLSDTFQGLLEGQDAVTALVPWWQMIGSGVSDATRAASDAEQRLRSKPDTYRLWQQRAVLLADQPDAARWLTSWHAALAADPQLADGYPEYLRRELSLATQNPEAWAEQYGPTPAPTPLEQPSVTVPTPPSIPGPVPQMPTATAPAAPIPLPPAPPTARPAMPELPKTPQFPERGMRPDRVPGK
jgi:hypothetical protein